MHEADFSFSRVHRQELHSDDDEVQRRTEVYLYESDHPAEKEEVEPAHCFIQHFDFFALKVWDSSVLIDSTWAISGGVKEAEAGIQAAVHQLRKLPKIEIQGGRGVEER